MRRTRFVRFFKHLNPSVVREIIARSAQQRLPGLAAEIAFSSILALFPALVALLTLIGLVGSSRDTFGEISQQLSQIAPQEVLTVIQQFIQELALSSSQSLLSISFVAAIWVASGAISSTMNALDQIHRVPRHRQRPFWKAKLVSLGLTCGTLGLLVGAAMLVFVSDFAVKYLAVQSDQLVSSVAKKPSLIQPGLLTLWSYLSLPISLGMVALAFAFLYRFGASRWTKGTPILPGAILATIFWAIFSGGFRLYVANFGNYNRIYGAVGALIVLLIWLQLGALTMLIGAQLNVVVGEVMRPYRVTARIDQPDRPLPTATSPDVTQNGQHDAGRNQYPEHTPRHKPQHRYSTQQPDQQG
jgi:membrane protein